MSVTLQDSTTRRYQDNVDAAEVAKFEALASRWWDPESEFKPLHDINPLRLDFIDARAGLAGGWCGVWWLAVGGWWLGMAGGPAGLLIGFDNISSPENNDSTK